MKTIPTALQQHYDSGSLSVAYGLKITRRDGDVFGFTSCDQGAVIDGVTYDAGQGLDVSALVATAGLAVDNLELTTTDDGSLFTKADILGGRWQGAAFVIVRYNWAAPGDGVEALLGGVIGQVTMNKGMIRAEFRGIQQYLQQPIGNVSTRTCRARFADFPEKNPGNRCGLSASTFSQAGEVVAVTSRQVFEIDVIEPDDWFGEGLITFTAGANDGLSAKIKTHQTDEVTLMLPLVSDVEVGDTFTIIAGCRKRLDEDCKVKFDNVLNFQGEPHRPTIDDITKPPEVSA